MGMECLLAVYMWMSAIYPTTDIYLTAGGKTYFLLVAIAQTLPYSVILGNDLPTLLDMIHQSDSQQVGVAKACQLVTRSQGRLDGLDELEAQPGKSRKLRDQRRRAKFAGQVREENAELPKPTSMLDFDFPSDVGILQKEDPLTTTRGCSEKVRR